MKAIVIAAGKGTRLADKDNPIPKVLRKANDRPLLSYVLDSIDFMDKSNIMLVIGYMHEKVIEAFGNYKYTVQGSAAYGTGYAVKCGFEALELDNYEGNVLILQGDVPLIKRDTINNLIKLHEQNNNSCTLLSCVSSRELPFGRIVRGGSENTVKAIVEHKDCSSEQRLIRELNVGLYMFDCQKLKKSLSQITNNNKAGEYYFTDAVAILCESGDRVDAFITTDETEMWGVNTVDDLHAVEEILRSKRN